MAVPGIGLVLNRPNPSTALRAIERAEQQLRIPETQGKRIGHRYDFRRSKSAE
jgi:hypothetical protein